MAKIVIGFKNRSEIAITCDSFKITVNNLTGQLSGCSWEGAKDISPMFIKLEDVLYIYQILEEEKKEEADNGSAD